MRPPKLHVTLLSAILLLRANARLLAKRLGLELVGATFMALAASAAFALVDAAPLRPSTWSAALLVGIVGGVCYFVLKLIARVGTIAVVLAQAQRRASAGIISDGADGFVHGLVGSWVLSLIDVLGFGCAVLAFQLGVIVAQAHGVLGAFVAAVIVAFVVLLWWLTASFAAMAFVLAVLDGDDIIDAWPRVWALVLSSEPEVRARFIALVVVLGALGSMVAAVDLASSLFSSVGTSAGGQGSFVMVPILTLVYATLVDAAAVVFFAALTDRLPLGFATPITLATPRATSGPA